MFSSSRMAAPVILRAYWGRRGLALCLGRCGLFSMESSVSWRRQHWIQCVPQMTDESWVFCALAQMWVWGVRQHKMCHKWYLTLNLFFFPRECSRIFGEDGLTLKLFLKRTAPFSILWTLTNYLYLLALRKLTATDVSALFCCNKAFVFLLSWIVLKDRFMGVRVMAHLIHCVKLPLIINPWHQESCPVSWSFHKTFL